MSRPDLQVPPESLAFPEPPAAPALATPPPALATPATADRAAGAAAADASRQRELQIARLEGRVAALEAALERRSQELRLLQRHLCPVDLAQLARLTAGLPPLPRIACEPGFWRETRDLTEADVPETMEALWSSLHPPGPAGPPMPPPAAGTPVPMPQEQPPPVPLAPLVPPVPDDPSGTPPLPGTTA